VALLNRSRAPLSISTTTALAGLPAAAGAYIVRDVWAHRTTQTAGAIVRTVPGDAAVLLRVSAG
jgi:alpha-galactosidase